MKFVRNMLERLQVEYVPVTSEATSITPHVPEVSYQDELRSKASVQLVPICLPCWRQKISMDEDPPQVPPGLPRDMRARYPDEECEWCGRRTNHGIYVEALREA